jgi:hypothetical protein
MTDSPGENNTLGGETEKKVEQLKREIDQVDDYDRKVALEETFSSLMSLVESRIGVLEKKVTNSPSPALNPAQKEAMESL